MQKDFQERNTLLAGTQQQAKKYSQEIAHEQSTFRERRIYGMTIRQIFHRSFNEQRTDPFEIIVAIQEQNNVCSS